MGHYRLFEWERRRFDAECAVPVDEAESLVRAAEASAKLLGGLAFKFGRDALKERNLVGIVAACGSSCEILPKVDRDVREDDAMMRGQLVRMLDVAYGLPVADNAATTLDTQSDTLLEVLIAQFVSLAQDESGRGCHALTSPMRMIYRHCGTAVAVPWARRTGLAHADPSPGRTDRWPGPAHDSEGGCFEPRRRACRINCSCGAAADLRESGRIAERMS